ARDRETYRARARIEPRRVRRVHRPLLPDARPAAAVAVAVAVSASRVWRTKLALARGRAASRALLALLALFGLLAPQDVAHDRRADAAHVLHERYLGVRDLVRAGLSSELQIRLDELIDARRADGVAARLEPAESRDRELPVEGDAAVGREPRALAGRGEAGCFEAQRRDDRVRVVQLEEIDVAVRDAGVLERTQRRALDGAEMEHVAPARERERVRR